MTVATLQLSHCHRKLHCCKSCHSHRLPQPLPQLALAHALLPLPPLPLQLPPPPSPEPPTLPQTPNGRLCGGGGGAPPSKCKRSLLLHLR